MTSFTTHHSLFTDHYSLTIAIMKNIISCLTAILLITSTACEDFLEKEPLGNLEADSFFQTEDDALLATNAVYNAYRAWFVTGGFPIADIMSDDMVKGSAPQDGAGLNLIDNFTFAPSEGAFSNIWSALFEGVRTANAAIENVPDIEMDEALKSRLLAEARFLRAAFYFDLARSYGDLPKVLTADPERQLTRSPVAEVYNEIIIPDLEFAIDNLPPSSGYDEAQQGRATQGAAQGLLAKVSLYREDFARAQEVAEAVINSGEYELPADFAEEFSPTIAFGPGAIFEIGALRDDFDNGGNQYGQTQGVRGSVLVGEQSISKGWGFGRPTVDIINFYADDDPRMDASVIFLGDTISGEVIIGDEGTPDTTYTDDGEIAQLETYNQKVFMPGVDENPQWGYNRKVLRYADVLLIAAEAANENGNVEAALQYLNQVHTRAMGEAIEETDPAALRQLIYDERRAELAFEGERFYDLVRTGRAAEVLGPLGFEAGKHELFPIPQSEIDITEGGITQNPGY